MPPLADSSDDDFQGDIPFKKGGDKTEDKNGSDNESGSGEEDGDEEEYIVERILGHEFKGKNLLFVVKWKGYDDPSDHTLEPEENLSNAMEAVNEYYEKIGGPPVKPGERKKRKSRASSAAATEKAETESATSAPSSTRQKRTRNSSPAKKESTPSVPDWVPKGNNWEPHVESIDTIMRDPEDPTGPLFVYLNWTNGHKSRVSTAQANKKCPQKMLQFYEQHIVFKDNSDES